MHKIIGGPVMKWKRMSGQRVFKRGFGGIALGSQRFKNPRTGKQLEFTIIMKPDGVTVFALTADLEPEVILVSQFKQAVGKIVFEAPGGQLEHRGEDVKIAARRELLQETGFVPGVLVNTGPIRIGSMKDGFWISPRSSERMSHTFLATECTMDGAQEQKLDPGEEAIGVYGCAPMEFWGLVERGAIRSIETVVAAYRAADLGAIPHRPQR